MSRIVAALVASVCMLTLSTIASPADAAPAGSNRTRDGIPVCC